MKGLFEQFLCLIFPNRCSVCFVLGQTELCQKCAGKIEYLTGLLCQKCGKPEDGYFKGQLCEDCSTNDPPFKLARSVAVYDGVLKDAIHQFKFNGRQKLSEVFGLMMLDVLIKSGIPLKYIEIIVPVPLSRQRIRSRGYNQSGLLADVIGRMIGVHVDHDRLKKTRDVRPQSELCRRERLDNVKGAFSSADFSESNILLVDDIYTTGATVMDAARALKMAGVANVIVLTLARAVILEGTKSP